MSLFFLFKLTEDKKMFSIPGGIEWIIILIVALLIFGRDCRR